MAVLLSEDKRNQFIAKGKTGQKEKDGKTRYEKRMKSKVKKNVAQLNRLNFNDLFKKNIITLELEVVGETDTYTVTVSFGGFLDVLKRELSRIDGVKLDLKIIIKSLIQIFNNNDIYTRCTCDDFKYRHAFYFSKNNQIVGPKETIPSNKTNPNDTLGAGCKHIMAVLSNMSWIVSLGSVIYNYINYMEIHYKKMYADIIYPAIYGKKYEEPVQLDFDTLDQDELDTSSTTVDKSNIYARDKNKFKKGNTQGIRFAKKERPQEDEQENKSLLDLVDEK